ncbi:MAG: ATP-dependent DNA ligase [Gemmatimonadetes bacterium 13_1_40CM_66_11]|nr:MAG: ATP-dependent DNA ligase [Gemmatimonadetes bacterium 13_1_40CM_66_11]
MLLSALVSTSDQVAATSGRLAKIQLLADLLKQAGPDEVELAIAYLSGTVRQSKIGVGWATLQKAKSHVGTSARLQLRDVDETLQKVSTTAGKGSAAEKQRLLGALFSQATKEEHEFLFRLLTGELRQGALEGIMVEAVAKARELPASDVRRAMMLAGNLGAVAKGDLKSFAIELFRPIKPMLAKTATDVEEALAELGPASFEYKLDGIRIQVHKNADKVRVYSRTLNDITAELPTVVDISTSMDMSEVILDGEAVVLTADQRPVRFQDTMKGLGGAVPFFFDILYLDGTSLLDQPYSARSKLLPRKYRPPRIITGDAQAAQDFFDAAIAAGQEGLMAKGLESKYEAGRRGGAWFKIKKANTLDLVVLAAEWGHGRRHGKLSNLHLGARDPNGGFVMLGKTFKGMTDEMLEWQTKRLQEIEVRREGHVVHVRPELVVEIAFNGLQDSPHYPGGLALRFARVIRYRDDKKPEDADTIETVRKLHREGAPDPDGK